MEDSYIVLESLLLKACVRRSGKKPTSVKSTIESLYP